MSATRLDGVFGLLPLRTVKRKLLPAEHWKFPSLGLFSSPPVELKPAILQNAVNYEYAREFETLADLHQDPQQRRLHFDKQGHWLFCGTTQRLSSDQVRNAPPAAGLGVYDLLAEQWSVSLDAAPGFPDSPFNWAQYKNHVSEAHVPGIISIKALKPGEAYQMPHSGFPHYSYYVVAVDRRYSNAELIEHEASRWIRKLSPKRQSNFQGRSLLRELEQDLKALAVLRLCCEHQTMDAAIKHTKGKQPPYRRRDDWERSRLRAIHHLTQWGLLVQTVAPKLTEQAAASSADVPLEIAAYDLAKMIIEFRAAKK